MSARKACSFSIYVKYNQLYKMTTTENIRKELQDLVDSKYQNFILP